MGHIFQGWAREGGERTVAGVGGGNLYFRRLTAGRGIFSPINPGQQALLLCNNFNMFISNPKYRLAELSRDNMDAGARLLAEAFLTGNDFWAAFKPDPQAVLTFMGEMISEMLDWQDELREQAVIPKDAFINFVYLDEADNIVGAWTCFELSQYSSKKSKVSLPQLTVLKKYGTELEKLIDPLDREVGRAIYSMFIAIKPALMGSGIPTLMWVDGAHYFSTLGFKFIYGRSSSIKSIALVGRYGGNVLAKIEGVENGVKVAIAIVKWPIRNINEIEPVVSILRNRLVNTRRSSL